jgi:hypothetical protein
MLLQRVPAASMGKDVLYRPGRRPRYPGVATNASARPVTPRDHRRRRHRDGFRGRGAAWLRYHWHAAKCHHEPAPAVGPRRPAGHLSRSRHHRRRSGVQPVPAGHYRGPPRLDRLQVGGRSGVVQRGSVHGLQRRPGEHPVPLYLGNRPGHPIPRSVVQQQRQRVRLPGAAAFNPGFQSPCHPPACHRGRI